MRHPRSTGACSVAGWADPPQPSVNLGKSIPGAEDLVDRAVFGWEVVVGREGIEPPQSKTADLQSAELTTCSTYPRVADGAWCDAGGGRWYQTDAAASTEDEYAIHDTRAVSDTPSVSLETGLSPREPSVPVEGLGTLFYRFLRFGLLAWGGPVAQIAMLRRELVEREGWISSERFNRTLAVYQALPGPEAHELCVYFGYLARGRIGGALAGLAFMLPGLLLMLALSWFYVGVGLDSPWMLAFFAGTQAAVLALIFRAVHRIGAHAVTDSWLATVALVSLIGALVGLHFALILAAAGLTYLLVARERRIAGLAVLGAVVVASAVTLAVPDYVNRAAPLEPAGAQSSTEAGSVGPGELLTSGLRAGLLTFGGAYTAIPFLEADVVDGGWMTRQTFLDGVALSGILPAPLIIFSTFVGYVAGGLAGALAMTAGIFAPAFVITLVGHRQLERLVAHRGTHALLDGITAGVVGLVAATALSLAPVAVRSGFGALIFAVALTSLYRWRSGIVVAAVVLGAGAAGVLLLGLLRVSP